MYNLLENYYSVKTRQLSKNHAFFQGLKRLNTSTVKEIDHIQLKFYAEPFSINKNYADELSNKVAAFKVLTKTRKQVFRNLISTFGLKPNEHSLGLIQSAMSIDVLFEKACM